MAGRGQRFLDEGYKVPKPLLNLGDEVIMKHILDIMRVPNVQFIFIVRQDHCDEYELDKKLLEIDPMAKVVKINEITEGAACTVLLAKDLINNEHPLIVRDCDQIANWNAGHFLEFVQRNRADGAIVNINTDKPNYSFSKVDNAGRIYETAEKKVISNHGSAGIYYFGKGSDFVKYAQRMIEKNIRTNNEFYITPVYNQFIEDSKLILHYPIAENFQLGTPKEFLENKDRAIEFLKKEK